jgi:hypothetical protein
MSKPKVGDRYKIEFEIVRIECDIIKCKTKNDCFTLWLDELANAEKVERVFEDGEHYWATAYSVPVQPPWWFVEGHFERGGRRHEISEMSWIGEKIERPKGGA